MKTCSSFEELKRLCGQTLVSVKYRHLSVARMCNVRLVKDERCTVTQQHIPADCQVLMPFPVKTRGDGSCFAHACSRLVYGQEFSHVELRCRLVIEGVCYHKHYKNRDEMSRGLPDDWRGCIIETYATLGGAYDHQNTRDDYPLVYNNDVFLYRLPGTQAGMWQVHAFVSILECKLAVIYPWLAAHDSAYEGHLNQRRGYNHIIYPRMTQGLPEAVSNNCFGAIMWTYVNADSRTPNHFMPIVP